MILLCVFVEEEWRKIGANEKKETTASHYVRQYILVLGMTTTKSLVMMAKTTTTTTTIRITIRIKIKIHKFLRVACG